MLLLSTPPDECGNSAAKVGANSTGLVSYPNMLRALGLSRYVGDRLRRERRFRIVASGKALFVPAVDVERLRVFLGEQDAAKAARDELAELRWFTRALEHRQPIALGRQTLRIVVCGSHLSQRVVEHRRCLRNYLGRGPCAPHPPRTFGRSLRGLRSRSSDPRRASSCNRRCRCGGLHRRPLPLCLCRAFLRRARASRE